MNVDHFSRKVEATGKQTRYIAVLCQQRAVQLEDVLEHLWGMTCVAAFSDRPWMLLTRREASTVIDHLKSGKPVPSRFQRHVDDKAFNRSFDSYVENFAPANS